MRRIKLWSVAIVAGWLMGGGVGWTADAPVTATVLGKLHHANLQEIAMGKLAEKNGTSTEVKSYGRTLVKDHTAADRKVVALAKQEKVDLAANTEPMNEADMASLPAGPDFDAKFAKVMLDGHEAVLTEMTAARDATQDGKLRTLLDGLLPTLRTHRDIAKKIVDAHAARAGL
jgi:putative membrane protein